MRYLGIHAVGRSAYERPGTYRYLDMDVTIREALVLLPQSFGRA